MGELGSNVRSPTAVDASRAVHVRALAHRTEARELADHLGQHLRLVQPIEVAHRNANDGHAALQRARADGLPVDLERAVA